MALTILAVGKKHKAWVEDGVQQYQKRLRAPFDVKWVLLPYSDQTGNLARQEESKQLFSKLKPDDYVVLLDERGVLLDSPALATFLETQFSHTSSIVLIIGGAFGVDDTIHARAQKVWSLSPLVFPHQLVRLILVEQLYRAQQITSGGKYHHK